MKSFISDPDLSIFVGDALETLRELADESVHCCVTSPPYWGLRDYGTAEWEGEDPDCDHRHETKHQVQGATSQRVGRANVAEQRNENFRDVCSKCGALRVDRQLGLEPTPGEYVVAMVEVFRELRRVLRHDGTVWLNLGDSYSQGTKGNSGAIRPGDKQGTNVGGLATRRGDRIGPNRVGGADVPAKDLIGIPWRVAFALQADGWRLRSDVVWWKPNPMPESVTDRPTKAHEYVFLLAKSSRYFYDAIAIKEPYRYDGRTVLTREAGEGSHENHRNGVRNRWPGLEPHRSSGNIERKYGADVGAPDAREDDLGRSIPWTEDGTGRNKRSVWEIATEPYAAAHFATFPQALVELCIGAGTSEHGCCADCGAPWQRTEDDSPVENEWRPTCTCAGVDYSLIRTPTGEGDEPDPSIEIGRAGMGRLRNEGEGTRPITRYEQQRYAAQLKSSPARPQMEEQAGADAFAHYIRTDKSGDRPVPPDLLEQWIACGWLERVEIPELELLAPVPCTVLDPFMGSGTTALVARKMGRRCVGIELSPEYAELIAKRTRQLSLFA